jgi:hypothetical protein
MSVRENALDREEYRYSFRVRPGADGEHPARDEHSLAESSWLKAGNGPVTPPIQLRVGGYVGASMDATPAELAAIPLFASLSEPDLAEIASWFDAKDVSEGTCLIGEGSAGYTFFVLADGAASVSASGDPIGTLGPGDFFGEIAILGDGRRSATVRTTAPSRVLVMFGTEFRRLQQTQPEVASLIEATMGERVAH